MTPEQTERQKDIRSVMESQRGRAFLWRVIEEAGVFSGSFDGDALTTAYTEGRRSVGIELMREAQATSAELYLYMLAEVLKERQLEAAKREAQAAETLSDE